MKDVLEAAVVFPRGRSAPGDEFRLHAVAWFCLRTHPKHEHIVAAQLRQDARIEVFLPRIRYKRSTRNGLAWVTEALFQNYVFARFDLALDLRRVRHSRGVREVVHFGTGWPTIPDEVVEELRGVMAGHEVQVIEETLRPGDPVQIARGAMHGLQAVVTRALPAKQRVSVLLEFLGRQIMVELTRSDLGFAAEDQNCKARLPFWAAIPNAGAESA